MVAFRRLYGSNPLHLLAHIGVFFIAGWAISQILRQGFVINWIAWFLGAALLHDLVLLPLYSALDRGLTATAGPVGSAGPGAGDGRRLPSPINYVRVPAVVSGILLLVYFPLILGYASKNYEHDTGHALAGYTRNWLLICGGVFLASAVVYGVRVVRSRPRSAEADVEHADA